MAVYFPPNLSTSPQTQEPAASNAISVVTVPAQHESQEPQIDCPTSIFEIVRSVPALAHLAADGRTMLEALLSLSIKYKLIMNPLSPEKREVQLLISQKKEAFTKFCQEQSINLPLDASTQSPVIFYTINDEAAKHVDNILAFRKQQMVQTCRKDLDLGQLSPSEFDRLYVRCSEEMQVVTRVTTKILNLIRFAKLPDAIKNSYTISLEHSGDSQNPFILSTNYLPLSYSIHDLLFGLGIRTGDYKGADVFDLNLEELKKLETHLSNLLLWADDFALIVGDLIGNEDRAKEFITLGQKPISEIMRNPIRMTEQVIDQLPAFRNMPCLLFNQLSLDLTQHPEKEFLKGKFIEFFRAENMLGSNGRPKDFLSDTPYQTVLNVEQVMKICPRLNKLLKFQQLVKEFTGKGTLQEAITALRNDFELPNELEVMKVYKVGILHELYRALLGPRTPQNILDDLNPLSLCSSIDTLEGKSLELCEELLKQYTGAYFRKNETVYTPTVAEKRALYDGQMLITYNGRQDHKNIAKLFSKLKESAPYREVLAKHRDLGTSVSELEAELVRRLNEYHTLSHDSPYYGRPMVDDAIRFLELYVAKIVYIAQSKVTQESVERSLLVLIGRNGADLTNGCARGLAGRINDMLIALTASVGNELQDHMNQFRRDCLEAVYQEIPYYRDNSESSMAIPEKAEAGKFLGIVDSNERKTYGELSEPVKTLLQHVFMRFHPVSIYHKARTFFSDKFWQLNKDNDGDENIYLLFEKLGFGSDRAALDKKYRVNADPTKKWQYAYIQQDLPRYLVPFLIQEKLLFVKPHRGAESVLQREEESPCTIPAPAPMGYPAPLRNDDLVERGRLLAQTEGALEPSRRAGQVLTSRLPEYQPSTS